jgi:hypothetical protein
MKTYEGRDIPMWEAKASKPMRCFFCEADKPLISRAYTFQTVEKAIADKDTVPWVPLCDEHRRPEMVDYTYLTYKEPIPGYEPSLLCGSIHVMPMIKDLHWGTECPHLNPEDGERGIGNRVFPAKCRRCDDLYYDATSCHGCRGSAAYLGDPKDSFYEVHMPDWVWDRFIKDTILEKKPAENLFKARDDNGPALFFNLTEGGRKFRLYEIGIGLINYMLRWKPVPTFDQDGNALEPWVYSKGKTGPSTTVGMAYMTPERTASMVVSFNMDDLTDEQKVKLAEATAKHAQEVENLRKAAP